jgi:hypothetical protein
LFTSNRPHVTPPKPTGSHGHDSDMELRLRDICLLFPLSIGQCHGNRKLTQRYLPSFKWILGLVICSERKNDVGVWLYQICHTTIKKMSPKPYLLIRPEFLL